MSLRDIDSFVAGGFTPRQTGLLIAAVPLVARGLAYAVYVVLPHASLSLVFILAVLIVAARAGRKAAVVTAVASFPILNFVFTPPHYTLKVDNDRVSRTGAANGVGGTRSERRRYILFRTKNSTIPGLRPSICSPSRASGTDSPTAQLLEPRCGAGQR